MRNFRILAALGLLGAATVANAGVSSTWTLTNDYDFRGITQSAQDPAIQGSVDFAADSGWYIGAWGSNVDFGPADVDLEVDVYTGFSGTSEGGLGYDVGLVYYAYPDENDFDYIEAYGSISKDWFKGKLWYSPDFGGDTTNGDTPAYYIEANGTFPLPQNFSILAHVGFSGGDYWDDLAEAGLGDEYFDYSVGVGYTINKFNLALKWVDGSDLEASDGTPDDVFSSESRVIFTIATTFPWSND
ncbi:TorF family putative porin [Steroidobacter agaridevorans]|uniref:TorF family putative porin n=1 Tax=Steroidobacter agaridevorans TaxID=2695856 RepID=UPI00132710F7|nr:TorF family putative porin [Steroidobacter agaridevorans]GFE91703.1 hypothetical protein GCM10011488_66570 [Steroidobacter agaridevorans]